MNLFKASIFFFLFCLAKLGQGQVSLGEVLHYYNDYRYGKALEALQSMSPKEADFDYYMLAAKVYRANLLKDSARVNFQRAAALDTQALAPLVQWALLEKSQQAPQKAIEVFRLGLKRDTGNAFIYRQLADLYWQINQSVSAISSYQKAIALQANDTESKIRLAKIYIDQQAYTLANQLCREALAIDSTQHQFWQLACLSAFRQKDYNLAWACGDLAFKQGADSSSTMLRIMGMTAYHTMQLEKAHLLLVRALLSGDESEKIFFYLGQIAAEQEEAARAEAYFTQAIQAGTSEALGVYELHLGFSLDDQSKFSEAIPHYQAAYRLTKQAVILYYLARDYDEAYRDKSQALEYYLRFIEEAGSDYFEYREYSAERISEIKKIQHFRAEEE